MYHVYTSCCMLHDCIRIRVCVWVVIWHDFGVAQLQKLPGCRGRVVALIRRPALGLSTAIALAARLQAVCLSSCPIRHPCSRVLLCFDPLPLRNVHWLSIMTGHAYKVSSYMMTDSTQTPFSSIHLLWARECPKKTHIRTP